MKDQVEASERAYEGCDEQEGCDRFEDLDNVNSSALVMVVDDESKIRRIVSKNLERAGFDVMSASDGMQAIEAFSVATTKPDLVLLDVMMPDLDGFECARRLRKISNVPIVFMTAKTDGRSKLLGFDLGADDYVCKPFSMEELLARIRAVLRRCGREKKRAAGIAVTELENGPIQLCIEKRQCILNGLEVHLSDTEFNLLAVLMQEPGIVRVHDELLHKVWGPSALGEVQYLRVAFTRLRRKFEEAGLEGGLISAYSGVGYVLRDLRDE